MSFTSLILYHLLGITIGFTSQTLQFGRGIIVNLYLGRFTIT
jgi:hypothetical protein